MAGLFLVLNLLRPLARGGWLAITGRSPPTRISRQVLAQRKCLYPDGVTLTITIPRTSNFPVGTRSPV